jgi:hypothetical protein
MAQEEIDDDSPFSNLGVLVSCFYTNLKIEVNSPLERMEMSALDSTFIPGSLGSSSVCAAMFVACP